ncbi:alcohol dehydrogenase catalytic domain-containing protein [Rathayibacter sp. VKM Ac-2760]|uniref:alcohol dehydrogenase catalytic domain-containing protein n=1 Tax=Rathayibacter sp. VKM Ac-2760 TaxID=2609253 RepID=UPI001FCA0B49|nr:alcohol dehydrogenase catalytic domain-containing protein [Rathayibacter sp. VKM Ac-2760]
MRAVVLEQLGGPEVLQVQDVPIPVPVTGQVLVRVEAFGLNRSELHFRRGTGSFGSLPRIPGIEAAGTVVEARRWRVRAGAPASSPWRARRSTRTPPRSSTRSAPHSPPRDSSNSTPAASPSRCLPRPSSATGSTRPRSTRSGLECDVSGFPPGAGRRPGPRRAVARSPRRGRARWRWPLPAGSSS